jgi:hypothetical protein
VASRNAKSTKPGRRDNSPLANFAPSELDEEVLNSQVLGWERHIDKNTGDMYLFNTKAGEPRWTAPGVEVMPMKTSEATLLTLMDGWMVFVGCFAVVCVSDSCSEVLHRLSPDFGLLVAVGKYSGSFSITLLSATTQDSPLVVGDLR